MRRITGALLFVLLVTGIAAGQEQHGSIEGMLSDQTGGVLPGVTVEASGSSLGRALVSVTDGKGKFRFPALPPGRYDLTATLQGFVAQKVSGIDISLGQIKRVELTLVPGVTEEIQVTSEAPIIDIKQSAAAASIRDELITKLPRGRNFTSVVTQAASAADEAKVGGIAIDGASGSENRYVVDGIETTNLQNGKSGKNVITDFIDEVQVKSSGYAAEYGGATGGVINVITKTGTQSWRGDVGGYMSMDNLNGAEGETLRLNPIDNEVAEYITYDKDDWNRLEPGGSLGGPIVKDRAWFFASYIPELTTTNRTVTFLSNQQTLTYQRQERRHYSTANVTSQIGSKLRLKGAVNVSSYARVGELPAREGTSNPLTKFEILDRKEPNTLFSGNADYSATNHLYLAARAGHFRYDAEDSGVPNEVWRQFARSNVGMAGVPVQFQGASGTRNILSNSATTQDLQSRTSFHTDATYFASFAGDHALKAGVQYDRQANQVQTGYQKTRALIYWGLPYTFLDGHQDRGTFGYYRMLSIVTTGDIQSQNVGLFLQDSWTVNDRLTLNLGIRSERERVPSFDTSQGQDKYAIEFGFGEKLAPRAGFAYDVRGDGKWKAYGSWGLFYDITKLEMPRGSFGGDKWVDYFYSLDTFDWTNLGGGPCPPECPGRFFESIDRRHPANSVDQSTIDPNLKPIRLQEFVVGLQHEIDRSTSLGFRFVHKQLDRTIEDVGVVVPGAELFFIANPGFGIAQHILGPDLPAQPKAQRDYDGVELEFTKRFAERWQVHASYLYSRLYGNYSGLASSDEINAEGNGRTSPNVNRSFDSLPLSFDQTGSPVYGRLETDRPHQFKVQGLYDFDFGSSVGLNFYAGSGTPVTRIVNLPPGLPVYYRGRGSDGRTPTLTQTDLYFQHEFQFGGTTAMQLSLNVLNLFDQDTAVHLFRITTIEDLGGGVTEDAYLRGEIDVDALIAELEANVDDEGNPDPLIHRDPRFLQPSNFQGGREVRLGLKYIW